MREVYGEAAPTLNFVIQTSQHRCYTHSLSQPYGPQSLRSSLGAPAGGVLVELSMQGMALRYS